MSGLNIIGLLNANAKSGQEKAEKEKSTNKDRSSSPTAQSTRPQATIIVRLTLPQRTRILLTLLQNQKNVKFYKQAIEHFAQGAKYGAMAQEKPLVLHAATNFWNNTLVLMGHKTRW